MLPSHIFIMVSLWIVKFHFNRLRWIELSLVYNWSLAVNKHIIKLAKYTKICKIYKKYTTIYINIQTCKIYNNLFKSLISFIYIQSIFLYFKWTMNQCKLIGDNDPTIKTVFDIIHKYITIIYIYLVFLKYNW